MKKIIEIVIILIICIFTFYNQVYCSYTDPITDPSSYMPSTNLENKNTKFLERAGSVLGVIRLLGTFVAVITLVTLGIRYMLGSIQEKAIYKETMGPYLIGAIMLFTIPNIIGMIYDFITANIK